MPRTADAQAGHRRESAPSRFRVPVLMYHEVTTAPSLPERFAVPPDAFARQMRWLRDSGYTTVTAAELAQVIDGQDGELPDRAVVLTFDDGFADFGDAVLPVLRDCGFTATLFVTTGWMADAEPRLAAGEAGGRPAGTISWGQLQAISDAGIEVGAHTVTHPQLDQLGGGRLGHELADCKALLQDRLGVAVTGMSYPFGYSDRAVRAATAAAGYRYACAVANRVAGRGDDRYAIPRITISRTTSPASFCRVIRGGLPPPEYLASRTLTKGYSVIRRSRSVLNRVWQ